MSVTVFVCAECGAPITAKPLRLARWPDEESGYDHERQVEPGECFFDPAVKFITLDTETGPPVPVTNRGWLIVHPEDVVGVRWYDEEGRWSGCCGPDGALCPDNLVCERFGRLIGTFYGDCWTTCEVRIEPAAVVDREIERPLRIDHPTPWPPGIKDYPKPRPETTDAFTRHTPSAEVDDPDE